MSQEGDQMINASNTEDANATSTKYWNIFSKCLNIENFVYRPLCVMIMSGLRRKGGGGEKRGLLDGFKRTKEKDNIISRQICN